MVGPMENKPSKSIQSTKIAPPLPKPRQYPSKKPNDVYLFGTCVLDVMFPYAGLDTIRLLEYLGINVHFPQDQSCCGQPAYTSGYTDEARRVAEAQLNLFKKDWPIIIPSGSCAGMMRHHYEHLFEDNPKLLKKVRKIKDNIYELSEFLLHVVKFKWEDTAPPIKIALHTSCSARREMDTHLHVRELLKQFKNVTRVEHDHESECCGFGGTFSIKMPDISGAMVLDKTHSLISSGADQIISADCGCLLNINGSLQKQKKPIEGQHIASFLWQRIGGKNE